MQVTFLEAKNGEQTVQINGIFVHSNYNPTKEAERFVLNIQPTFNPHIIIITEPGISHIIPFFKKRFPDCQIGIVRYSSSFDRFNSNVNFIFYFENQQKFENQLFNTLGEENILNTLFLNWEPSSKALKDIDLNVWKSIKNCNEKAKTLLITRQYFEKKWVLNCINYLKYSQKFITLKQNISLPVLIIASGPSLKPAINIIKENQTKFFVICLSSAVSVCLINNILPDMIMSTDGGYWAYQHLKPLNGLNIPILLPPEAYFSKSSLGNTNLIPSLYSDGISNKIFNLIDFTPILIKRNGTVSGTALDFAFDYSSNDIFFAGLDLANQKGFQHTQPNQLELNSFISDNKINNSQIRAVKGQFNNSTSLSIYEQWFRNVHIQNRKVYRIINKELRHNQLGEITDITVNDFSASCNSYSDANKDFFKKIDKIKLTDHQKKEIIELLISEKSKKQLYPLDYVLLNHSNNDSQVIDRIEEKHSKLISKVQRILNE